MTRRHYSFVLVVLLAFSGGCSKNEGDGLTKQETQMADRLDTIVKQSGGDWEKVSAADRDYLIKEVSQGSEQSAKMLLAAKADESSPSGCGSWRSGTTAWCSKPFANTTSIT